MAKLVVAHTCSPSRATPSAVDAFRAFATTGAKAQDDLMQLSKGGHVAVVDGENFALFHNMADGGEVKLSAVPSTAIDADHKGAGRGHASSSANPDDSQRAEDGFAVGVADHLNKLALGGKLDALVVIAAPRTLGELRKHYHKSLEAVIVKELSKDLTGQSAQEIEKVLAAA